MKISRKRKAALARGRRRFRYRRLHFLRLDVIAVVFLFVAGWLLCPSFERDAPSAAAGTKLVSVIIEQGGARADVMVLAPTVFAFTSSGGFADGVVAAGLETSTETLALLPPLPEQSESKTWPQDRFQDPWPGESILWRFSMPTGPTIQKRISIDNAGNTATGVKTWMSASGVEVPDGFATDLKSGRGKTVRVYIVFGADGRAEDVILGQNTLDSADASTLERQTMRTTGTPGLFAWITIAIP